MVVASTPGVFNTLTGAGSCQYIVTTVLYHFKECGRPRTALIGRGEINQLNLLPPPSPQRSLNSSTLQNIHEGPWEVLDSSSQVLSL